MRIIIFIALFAAGCLSGAFIERSYPGLILGSRGAEVTPTTDTQTPVADEGAQAAPEERIPVPTERLSDGQKKLISSFGMDPSSITVTKAMVECAESALGSTRYEQILSGATPTFNESLTLLSCYRR